MPKMLDMSAPRTKSKSTNFDKNSYHQRFTKRMRSRNQIRHVPVATVFLLSSRRAVQRRFWRPAEAFAACAVVLLHGRRKHSGGSPGLAACYGTALLLDLGEIKAMAFREITSNGTYVLKSSGGFLQSITVNEASLAYIQVYDSLSASGEAILGGSGPVPMNEAETLLYDVQFLNGLTVLITNAADGCSVTVSFL
jgi:hypothetical protein